MQNEQLVKVAVAALEDMKGPCVFLASDASDYLNGAIIPVDGGYLVK